MKDREFSTRVLKNLSKANHYNDWIFELFTTSIGKKVIEVGSGQGAWIKLLSATSEVVATDISEEYIVCLKKQYQKSKRVKVRRLNVCSNGFRKLKKEKADTVFCLNVLEHIRDDDQALKNMFEVLERKGKLCLLVPAFSWLYGSLDKNLGHRRRYPRRQLTKKLKRAGFQVKKCGYFNFFGFFGWFLVSRLFFKQSYIAEEIGFFNRLVPFLRFIEKKIKIPFGQSIFFIAYKS